MKIKNLNPKVIKLQSDMLWKKQGFQRFLKSKLLYALEFGDVMIDNMELKKFLKKRSVK